MRPGRVNLGAILVVVGFLLLMMTWGFLEWNLWWNLLQWWPAFLVVLGLYLALQRTRFWFLPTLFALLLIMFAVSIGGVRQDDWQARTLSAQVPLSAEAKEARLRLDIGTGVIRIGSGGAGLYEADFRVFGAEPSQVQLPQPQAAMVELRQEDRRAPKWLRGLSELWDMRLTRAIPLDVEISSTVAGLEVTFADLQLRTLDISAGLARIELRLGETHRRTDVFINATLAEVTLVLPVTVGLRVKLDSLLTSHNLAETGFVQSADGYYNSNFFDAESTVDIYIAATGARVKVRFQETL
ncbi:MAG TPA: hypothetical protein GXZ82_09965 [Firmicutes bacterium]|nr:hypothetical protein [Bacillota bacterium]